MHELAGYGIGISYDTTERIIEYNKVLLAVASLFAVPIGVHHE
jgi:hypothetical membrane protein